jgi:hypothetical protein
MHLKDTAGDAENISFLGHLCKIKYNLEAQIVAKIYLEYLLCLKVCNLKL